MLCSICRGIFSGSFLSLRWQAHHETITALRLASLQGCWVCEDTWKQLLRKYWAYYAPDEENSLEAQEQIMMEHIDQRQSPRRGTKYTRISYRLWTVLDQSILLSFKFNKIDTEYNDKKSFIISSEPLSVSVKEVSETLSSSGQLAMDNNPNFPFELAKSWIQKCQEGHIKCPGKVRMQNWYPTRLLQLDPSSSKVRLIVTRENILREPYITLSHCWGIETFYKLTAATFDELCSGVEITSLAQTFRDAIYTTMQLDVKYLWIDSLCIIQEDTEDWIKESIMMGRVYENGLCNIAATKSSAAKMGFLSEDSLRTESIRPATYIQSTWDDKVNSVWQLSPCTSSFDDYLVGPLLNRGWFVQERILAPRLLHFGSNQLFWECHDLTACESFLDGFPLKGFWASKDSTHTIARKHDTEALCNSTSLDDTIRLWEDIVVLFSNCQLTKEEDKLYALSGIAATILERFPNAEYLSGMWRISLERQLLWNARYGPGTQPKLYRAPSWSWASIDGPIEIRESFLYCIEPPLIDIWETAGSSKSADPTELVKSIRITGPLFTATVNHSDRRINDNFRTVPWYDKPIPDVQGEVEGEYHCLPVFRSSMYTGKLRCLLLLPTGERRGQFRRVGTMPVDIEKFGVKWRGEQRFDWKMMKNEDWFEYEERNFGGLYTITIV